MSLKVHMPTSRRYYEISWSLLLSLKSFWRTICAYRFILYRKSHYELAHDLKRDACWNLALYCDRSDRCIDGDMEF